MHLADAEAPFSFDNSSDVGVVLVHGFTGTTASVRYLGAELAKAGFNVEGPSLSGHGSDWRAMNRVRHEDWVGEVNAAVDRARGKADRVFLGGLSMGGALALHLAQRRDDLAGLILINHALFLKKDWRLHLVPILRFVVPSVEAISNDLKDKSVVEPAYDRTPVPALYELMKLLKAVRRDLDKVRQPVLILKSREDHVIPPESATYTFEHVASTDKKLVWLENSYHVATMDFDRDIIAREAAAFMARVIGREEAA